MQIDQLRSQFLSMVSHELRTPLTAIQASLQLLQDPDAVESEAERHQLMHTSFGNTQRLIRIVNDMLDMSTIDAGQMVMECQPCPAAAIVRDAVRVVEPWATRLEVRFETRVPDGLPPVYADHGRSVQVTVNLLSNAIKHAPAGSAIDVTAAVEEGRVRISVRDRGPGIPPDRVNEIFKPFVQLDGRDTRRIEGTGLGLTVAKALVEQQGGTIRVVAAEGGGAQFEVALPVVRARAATLEPPAPRP